MMTTTKPTRAKFFKHLIRLIPQQFSGKVKLQNTDGKVWQLYFDRGCITWATGGSSSWRRWRRNLTKFCSHISLETLSLYTYHVCESWQYYIVNNLLKQEKISLSRAINIINNTLIEVLFDLIQQYHLETLQITSLTCNLQTEMKQPIFRLSIYEAFEKVKPIWQAWCEANLQKYSPNLALVLDIWRSSKIKSIIVYKSSIISPYSLLPLFRRGLLNKPELLQQYTSVLTYQKLQMLISKKRKHFLRNAAKQPSAISHQLLLLILDQSNI